MPRPEKVRLGEILLQQGLLTELKLQEALDEQRKSGRKLGRVFVDKSFVSEEQISDAMARQLRVPYINLKHFSVKSEVAMRLPETQARRFRAIVLEDGDSFYRVAMAENPVGHGSWLEGTLHYHLEVGGRFIEVGCRSIGSELLVLGSSTKNAEGNYIVWVERLQRVSDG